MERRRVPRLAPPDRAMLAWQERRTLDQWRAADDVLRRSAGSEAARTHEHAVAAAVAGLDRFTSVEALVEHWRVDRYRRVTDVGAAPEGTIEAWVREACHPAEGALPPDEEVVAGAALWRRARELMEHRPR